MRSGWFVVNAALLAAWGLMGCSPRGSQDAQSHAPKATAPADPAIDRIAARVRKDGAAAYLGGVSDEDPDWQRFLVKLAEGDGSALSLAARLRPAADAGTAEAVDMATAQSLPNAPFAVLKLIEAGGGVDALCTSPFIEPEAGVERRYNIAALRALDQLPVAKRSQPAFDSCHRSLEGVAKRLVERR